jgi:hypothetical protein
MNGQCKRSGTDEEVGAWAKLVILRKSQERSESRAQLRSRVVGVMRHNFTKSEVTHKGFTLSW